MVERTPDHTEDEWRIRVSRGAGMGHEQPTCNFQRHVVRVHSSDGTACTRKVEDKLALGERPWDPIEHRLSPLRRAESSRRPMGAPFRINSRIC